MLKTVALFVAAVITAGAVAQAASPLGTSNGMAGVVGQPETLAYDVALAPWLARAIHNPGPATPFIYRPERTIARLQEIRGVASSEASPHGAPDLIDKPGGR